MWQGFVNVDVKSSLGVHVLWVGVRHWGFQLRRCGEIWGCDHRDNKREGVGGWFLEALSIEGEFYHLLLDLGFWC